MAKTRRNRKAVTPKRRTNPRPHVSSGHIQGGRLRRLLASVRANSSDIPSILALAEYYVVCGEEEKLPETIDNLESAYPFAERLLRVRYNRLLGIALASERRLEEAEYVIDRALREYPRCADLYYVLGRVKRLLGEHDEAIMAGEKYLALSAEPPQTDSTDDTPPGLEGLSHKALIELASANREIGRYDPAIEYYKRAIAAATDDSAAYAGLATLYQRLGRPDDARAVIDDGLRRCRQVQELKMLRTVFAGRATVSACMIVKNEEEQLGRALASIRDWVNEIIVVDTGSTDRTMEIAKSFGARIFHQAWEGDFSKHRNYSIEQATGDWIFIIDADEEISGKDLGTLFSALNDERLSILSVSVLNVYGDTEDRVVFLPSPRFFRRGLKLRYEGIVHNQLIVPDNLAVARINVRLKHYGYDLPPDKMAQKTARSKQLLEHQLESNPDDAFALFNYAQLLRAGKDRPFIEHAPTIIRCASRAAELTDPQNPRERHIHLMSLDQLSWAHFFQGNLDIAMELCRRALRLKPDYLDPLLLVGHIDFKSQDYEKAEKDYRRYLDVQAKYDPSKETDNLILIHLDNRAAAWFNLAMIAYLRGRVEEARGWLHRTLELNPRYAEANGIMGKVCLQDGRVGEACGYFQKQIASGHGVGEAAVHLAQIYAGNGDYERAQDYLRLAEESRPVDGSVLLRIIKLYRVLGKSGESDRLLAEARNVMGDDVFQQRLWAETLDESGRHEEAIDIYCRLIESQPQDAELVNDLANCYYRLGRYAEAEEKYLRALAADMPPAAAYRNLGLTRARMGNHQQAVDSLEHYLQLAPDSSDILHVVADLYVKMGRFEEAVERYEQALRNQPGDAGILFSLSECYLRMGHRVSAAMGYRRVLEMDGEFGPAADRLRQLSEHVTSK